MFFLHGWPELGLVWRKQIEHFAALGWRCIAPDMRGYGGSSKPENFAAYTIGELVTDMLELHDAHGGKPAVWVGHDWGSAVAWAVASHHPERCRGVVSLCILYVARGFTLPTLASLVDRDLYPESEFPVGQWDYWLFYREHFQRAAQVFDADAGATLALIYQSAPQRTPGIRALTSRIRAQGGWFGPANQAPDVPRDARLLGQEDFDALVAAFTTGGFSAPAAWYMNDAANAAYAAQAGRFGKITLPALFVHATNDIVCDTVQGALAEPMREDCSNLTEQMIEAGHWILLEKPVEVNRAISAWLEAQKL